VLTGGVLANSPIGALGFDGSGAAGGAGYGMTTTNGAMTLSSIVSDPGSSFDSMSQRDRNRNHLQVREEITTQADLQRKS